MIFSSLVGTHLALLFSLQLGPTVLSEFSVKIDRHVHRSMMECHMTFGLWVY